MKESNMQNMGKKALESIQKEEQQSKSKKCTGMGCVSEEKPESTVNQIIKTKTFKIFSFIQLIIIGIVIAIILTLIFLSGSIAVSSWSKDGDPGTITKIIVFIFFSFIWIIYLPYYYIGVVLLGGSYYTSNIYPLPSWLG